MNSQLSSAFNDDNCMEISVTSTIQSDMLRNMNKYRLQNHLCDVTLVVDGQNLYGHRVILSSASPYFETMFKSGLLESTLGKVNIREIPYETMGQIITFIYTGKLILTTIENAQSVIAAAHYFLMTDLVEECAKYFIPQLNIDNCSSIWKLLKSVDATLNNINNYVSSYFSKLVESETYLELDIDDITEFLYIDKAFYGADIESCVARWLEYDEKRKMYNERIQQCIKSSEKNLTSGGWIMVFPKVRDGRNEKNCVKLYDSIKQKWIEHKIIRAAHDYLQDIVVDSSNLYVVKNCTKNFEMKKYNFDLKVWTEMPPLNERFIFPAITIYKKRIFLCGGYDGLDRSAQSICYCFDLQTNEWSRLPSMLQRRMGHRAAVIGKYIYACGGGESTENPRGSSVERFDIDAQRWEPVQPMLTSKAQFSLAVYKNKLYAHNCITIENNFEMYDPATDKWTELPAPNLRTIESCRLVATHEGIYVLQKNEKFNDMHFYNVEQKKWFEKPSTPFAIANAVAAPLFPYYL